MFGWVTMIALVFSTYVLRTNTYVRSGSGTREGPIYIKSQSERQKHIFVCWLHLGLEGERGREQEKKAPKEKKRRKKGIRSYKK